MEVNSVLMDHKDGSTGDVSIKNLTSPGSSDLNNVFGDPLLMPRVGEKYQVDIPAVVTESERLELLANPFDSPAVNSSHVFLVGLPIPITWVLDGENNTADGCLDSLKKSKGTFEVNRPLEARNGKKGQSRKKSSEINIKEHKDEIKLENSEPMSCSQLSQSRNYYAAPGLVNYPWNDAEVDSFVLGLYIYGKNFIHISKFMGNKDLGPIQSYYYGKFYRSDAHRRWSRSRKKVRRKKCVIGRKIFTGWRQQELLSRLSSHVSEETQKSLQEGYKSFAEGQTSFEEYISLLKSAVGVPVLVEVIGIGKGKEDLTCIVMDPGKSSHDIGQHLPTGQDCTSLTSKEIMNLLTGGFRLSKGRCNDIFWDAVWPRLLAKGWHSEQPKNQGYISSKNCLIFLMPGIKKFSRRKLAKGEHYFDSVSDVLNKVASEPRLIELESEESSVGARSEQEAWSPEAGSDQDDQSGSRRPCYLKPRLSTSSSIQMKFTVVDTSLVYEGKSTSIRELRHLPAEFTRTSKMINCLMDDEDESSEDNLDDFRCVEKQPLQGEKARRLNGVSDGRDPKCMKFTVVDTCLVLDKKPSKVRDLRCLPMLTNGVSELTGFPRKTATFGESLGKHERDASDVPLKSKRKTTYSSFKSNSHNDVCGDDSSKSLMATKNNSGSENKMHTQQNPNTSISDEKLAKKTVLHQFRRRAKPGHLDSVVPVVKRRRLTACAKAKVSDLPQNCYKGSSSEHTDLHGTMNSPKTGPNVASQDFLNPVGNPDEDIMLKELRRNCSSMQTSEASNAVDPPQGLLDSIDSGVVIETETNKSVVIRGHGSHSKEELGSEAFATFTDANTSEQGAMVNRRQSTRNRPLTTRALEALANGFLNVQRRSKNSGVLSGENPFSNPCRKARSSKVKVALSHGDTVSGNVTSNEGNEASGVTHDVKNHEANHLFKLKESGSLTIRNFQS